MGTEPQPNMELFCSIKILEYSIIKNPDKSNLKVAKLEVVKTHEVRDSNIIRYDSYPDFAIRAESDEGMDSYH